MKYTKNSRRNKAFTLIELLVVISIIALLLAILTPALGKARAQAQAAICLTNLKTWGTIYSVYASENADRFPEYGDTGYTISDLAANYFKKDLQGAYKAMMCPTAQKTPTLGNNPTYVNGVQHELGGTRYCWWLAGATNMKDTDIGKQGGYGENLWLRRVSDTGTTASIAQNYNSKTWQRVTAVKQAYKVPVVFDCKWIGIWAENSVAASIRSNPTTEVKFYSDNPVGNCLSIKAAVMRRHKEGINAVFADNSVRNLKAEELFQMNWYRGSVPGDVGSKMAWVKW